MLGLGAIIFVTLASLLLAFIWCACIVASRADEAFENALDEMSNRLRASPPDGGRALVNGAASVSTADAASIPDAIPMCSDQCGYACGCLAINNEGRN